MGDGHETASAVERLLARWRRREAEALRRREVLLENMFSNFADALQAALEEDGVIPTRK